MKIENYESNARNSTLPQHVVCRIENLEIPNFFGVVIKLIARATKNGSVGLGKQMLKLGSWLDKKWKEGAEIHNRALRESDRRYVHNFQHIRGVY